MKLVWQNKSHESLKAFKALATTYTSYVTDRFALAHDAVSITIVTKPAMRKLNHTFRGINEATDVLTFNGDESYLGDIIICYAVVVDKAKQEQMSTTDYFVFTVVHGLLHALGYDHQTDKDYEMMIDLQDDIIKQGASYERTT